MKSEPPAGPCHRCKQPRHLFRYVPLHHCNRIVGLIDHIAWLEENHDRWCLRKIQRSPEQMVCTSCVQSETAEEQYFIETFLEYP